MNFNGLPPGINSGGDGSEVGRPAASHNLGATLRAPALQLEPSIGSEDHEPDVELRHVVKAAWDRWIGVLRDHGWGADAVLRPPAEVGAVNAAMERADGLQLPSAVRALYDLNDGQEGPRRVSDLATNIFPGYGNNSCNCFRLLLQHYGCGNVRKFVRATITGRPGRWVRHRCISMYMQSSSSAEPSGYTSARTSSKRPLAFLI